jgi:phospholipid/cholesterol/gamma-HCH transport system substrate-binding protein
MKNKKQKIRLGIFIFTSSALLFLLVAFFAARQFFEKTDTYYISYHDVSVGGLEVGSPVKYLGINIGSISDISIDPKDVNNIIVELALTSGTPVKKDSHADIVSMGITGLKTIEIRGGTNQAPFLREGDFINAGASAAEEITGKATIIAEKTEKVINNLQLFTAPDNLKKFTVAAENINLLAGELNTTVQSVDTLIDENRTTLRETISTAYRIAGSLDSSSVALNDVIGKIQNIIQSNTIQQILGNIEVVSQHLKETDLQMFMEDLVELTNQTRLLVYKIDQVLDVNSPEFEESLRLLRITLSNLEETSNKINSDPSILIRGFADRKIPDKRLSK